MFFAPNCNYIHYSELSVSQLADLKLRDIFYFIVIIVYMMKVVFSQKETYFMVSS